MKQIIKSILGLTVVGALFWLAIKALPAGTLYQPMNAGETCGQDFDIRDNHEPFSAEIDEVTRPGYYFTKIAIMIGVRDGTEECRFYETNLNDGCYATTGIGTNSVKVTELDPLNCKKISHAEFWLENGAVTETPFPTEPPPVDTETPPTLVTPPVPSDTPEDTPDVFTQTPVVSPTMSIATPTATDDGTPFNKTVTATVTPTSLPSTTPEFWQTATVPVLLPETGAGEPTSNGVEVIAVSVFIFALLIVFGKALVGRFSKS